MKRKPTRRDLLVVIGRLQSLLGEARSENHDRNPNRQAKTDAILDEAHALCIEVRSWDPPYEDAGPWSTTNDDRPKRRSI